MGSYYQHRFKQGEKYSIDINIRDSNGLINTAGWTGASEIKTLDKVAPIGSDNQPIAFAVTFPTIGTTRFTLTPTQTHLLTAKRYLYDARLVDASGTPAYYFDGDVIVQRSHTQSPVSATGGGGGGATADPYPQYTTDPEVRALIASVGGAGGGVSVVKIPFSFGDASPKLIYQIQGVVYSAAIAIIVPFNGAASTLKIGDATVNDRLLSADQNDPSTGGEYETNPCFNYSSLTQLYLTIAPGSGITQGSGFVILEV